MKGQQLLELDTITVYLYSKQGKTTYNCNYKGILKEKLNSRLLMDETVNYLRVTEVIKISWRKKGKIIHY